MRPSLPLNLHTVWTTADFRGFILAPAELSSSNFLQWSGSSAGGRQLHEAITDFFCVHMACEYFIETDLKKSEPV